jgi:hypothetical protein
MQGMAARRYADIMRRFDRFHTEGHRTARAQDYSAGRGGEDQELERRGKDAANELPHAPTIEPSIEPSMAGPSSKNAQKQEQEQNITPAPLPGAGERGKSLISEEAYAITGEVLKAMGRDKDDPATQFWVRQSRCVCWQWPMLESAH